MGYLLDDLEKMASTIRYDDKGNPMVSMYDDDSIPYIDNFEKNKRTIKRIGPGIAMAGLGVGLDSLKEKMPNSAAKNIPKKLTDGLILGGTGLAAVGGTYNYIKERKRNKRIAAYDQEKTAGLRDSKVVQYFDKHPGRAMPAIMAATMGTVGLGSLAKKTYDNAKVNKEIKKGRQELEKTMANPAKREAMFAELKAEHKGQEARDRRLDQMIKRIPKMTDEEIRAVEDNFGFNSYDEMKKWNYHVNKRG